MYPISPRPRAFVAVACGAAIALAAGAAVAFAAATVTTNRSCYVVRQTVQLSGSGFAPTSSYTVAIDGVYLPANLSTDSNGDLSLPLHPGGLPAGAAQHTDQVTVNDGSGDVASTSFTLTRSPGARLADAQKTSRGYRGRFQVWGFARDGTEQEVYLHYAGPSGRRHATVALGRTSGACGYLVSKRRLFVPFTLSRGTWTLQVDTRRSYSRRGDGPVARIRVGIS